MTKIEEQKLQTEINKMLKETSHISFKEKIMQVTLYMAAGAGIVKIMELAK